MLEAGISDVLLCCSQFAGHSKISTTYKYVKNLINQHFSGVRKIKAPDLNQNIFKPSENTTEELIKKITSHPKFSEIIKEINTGQENLDSKA